jgi:hypothetical protein
MHNYDKTIDFNFGVRCIDYNIRLICAFSMVLNADAICNRLCALFDIGQFMGL